MTDLFKPGHPTGQGADWQSDARRQFGCLNDQITAGPGLTKQNLASQLGRVGESGRRNGSRVYLTEEQLRLATATGAATAAVIKGLTLAHRAVEQSFRFIDGKSAPCLLVGHLKSHNQRLD